MKKPRTLGVMIDMSRNAVMNLPALKRFLTLLKKMGYNCVMLYTEDTYEVEGEPYFGYMRGRYSIGEMKEIDGYAASLGIEIIPCIQTLAHMNAFIRWDKTPVDCDNILMTDDERTYELIDNMFKTLSECFRSRRIHIGMDEAHNLGRGKHLDKFGYEPVDSIMKRHLAKVCELAQKYNYEPMMWSDMFFRPWNKGSYYLNEKAEIPKEYIDALPQSVIPVYWDYYALDKCRYGAMIENHKQLSKKTWFAGGAWCWGGFIPYNRFTLDAMLPALDACREHNLKDIFFTMWGDDGAECSHFSQLPSLFYLAEYSRGNKDEEKIKAKFLRLTGIPYDEFMNIDLPNNILPYNKAPVNPSKYMLYSDYFNDFLDTTVKPGRGIGYESIAKTLYATAKKSRRYGYVFNAAARLCDVLSIKYELGLRTRRAYEAGDKEELRRLAENEYKALLKLIPAFERAFLKQWMTDNKPQGFDVQEQRLGGIILRTESCRRRILDYVNGRLERIEELEEELLPYASSEKSILLNKATAYLTTGLLFRGCSSWETPISEIR